MQATSDRCGPGCSDAAPIHVVPRWMHTVADDAWWNILEIMGLWWYAVVPGVQ